MDSKETENSIREEKRKRLLDLGVNPYPHNYKKTHSISQVLKEEKSIQVGETSSSEPYTLAGRILLKRDMGKAAFFNIRDEEGDFQCYIRKDDFKEVSEIGENKESSDSPSEEKSHFDRGKTPSPWELWKLSDIGDIVGVSGPVFRTRKGELSLRVQQYQILCKTLEPLPEKYHGLEDKELKYRFRHWDLIMDLESRKVFKTRSKILQEIRSFMNKKGFMEVETPTLQPVYGGANAAPFATEHRRLKRKLYLKISPEIYLKKLIVGGFEKVYEIGKNFRNEGIDRTHNPEFTMMEYYEAYTDYKDQMKQFKKLICHVTKEIKGSLKFEYQRRELDFTKWEEITLKEAVKKYSVTAVPVDPDKMDFKNFLEYVKSLDPKGDFEKFEAVCNQLAPPSEELQANLKDELLVMAFELTAEKKLWNPTFVTDFPLALSPLTKKHRNKKYQRLVERFEPYIAGMEIGNAYTELNDPVEQKARLVHQQRQDNHPLDENFIHALEVGMPPTGGVGLGIERLVMILTNQSSIKDTLLFPILKSI